jgi:hypothetical protein
LKICPKNCCQIKEPVKNSTEQIVEHLFELELDKIRQGKQNPSRNKKDMAKRIFKAGKERELWNPFKEDKSVKEQEESFINTIIRKLGDLKYKDRMKQLKTF